MHLNTLIVLLVVTKVFLIKLSLKFCVDSMIRHTVPSSLRATRLGFPRVRRWGKGRGKGELALTSHKFYICVPEWMRNWLIGWFLIMRWRYVPPGELACRLTGETPSLVWNLRKPFTYCSNEKISFRALTLLKLHYRWVTNYSYL